MQSNAECFCECWQPDGPVPAAGSRRNGQCVRPVCRSSQLVQRRCRWSTMRIVQWLPRRFSSCNWLRLPARLRVGRLAGRTIERRHLAVWLSVPFESQSDNHVSSAGGLVTTQIPGLPVHRRPQNAGYLATTPGVPGRVSGASQEKSLPAWRSRQLDHAARHPPRSHVRLAITSASCS